MKKTLIIGLTTLSLALIAGCSTQDTTKEATDATEQVTGKDQKTVDVISVQDAVAIFEDAYPDAKITSVKLERQSKTYIYKIKGFDGDSSYKVKIEGVSKDTLEKETKSLDKKEKSEDSKAEIDFTGLMSINKITDIAEKEAGAGEVKEWKLRKDTKSDKMVWKVEVKDGRKETDVVLDAKTGDIISIKKD